MEMLAHVWIILLNHQKFSLKSVIESEWFKKARAFHYFSYHILPEHANLQQFWFTSRKTPQRRQKEKKKKWAKRIETEKRKQFTFMPFKLNYRIFFHTFFSSWVYDPFSRSFQNHFVNKINVYFPFFHFLATLLCFPSLVNISFAIVRVPERQLT